MDIIEFVCQEIYKDIAMMGDSATHGRQIDIAERRVTIQHAIYDANNVHWKHCDNILEQ